ncbi:primosomal replication protein N [Chitinimonas viridis]|uniref:Replication restart protein PriB n=2 Tax=Chitinimonas TaxID=240411 RepID=A0ABT8B5T6_9NEIS|nr:MULTISPECIES: primosomal replication protein N [Chitinimonas]MDN3577100.1 primosomal replication protein N [Chitinimonas viridis]GLR13547.1 primosomal replication protein N [Chitinimonas prasina]
MSARNQVVAHGQVLDLQPLRYTPAGIPAVEFKLMHESTQTEAGAERQIQCEMPCVCLGDKAKGLASLAEGSEILIKGFLAGRSQRYKHSLVLHITDWKRVTE